MPMRIDFIFTFILIASLVGVMIGAVLLARNKNRFLTVVFFASGVICSLLSTVYWLVYDLLRPETRMPFAANEIAEWAMLLLFASCLTTVFPARNFSPSWLIPTALFAVANTALWIGWSGEWVEDILTGLCFGWFLCCTVGAMKQSGALKKGEWIALTAVAFVIVLLQALTFVLPENLTAVFDILCGVLLFSVALFLLVRTLLCLSGKDKGMSLSFALVAWSMVTMYMTGGGWYLAAVVFLSVSLPLILWMLKKEVTAK